MYTSIIKRHSAFPILIIFEFSLPFLACFLLAITVAVRHCCVGYCCLLVYLQNIRSDRLNAIKKEKEAKELKVVKDILENRFARIEEAIQEIEESLPTSSTVSCNCFI